MDKADNKGIGRIIRAFGHSMRGIKDSFKTEAAFRQESFLCGVLLILVFVVDATATQKALLIFSIFFVLVTEIVNTAIEALADRISTEKHHLLGKAKDAGSAAVFLSLVNLVAVWCIVLLG